MTSTKLKSGMSYGSSKKEVALDIQNVEFRSVRYLCTLFNASLCLLHDYEVSILSPPSCSLSFFSGSSGLLAGASTLPLASPSAPNKG